MSGSKILRQVIAFFAKIERHNVLIVGASLAYTTALATAPLIVLLFTVISLFGPEAEQNLGEQLVSLFGVEAGPALVTIMHRARSGSDFQGLTGFTSLVIVIFSASSKFSQLRFAFDKMNEHPAVKHGSSFLKGFGDRVVALVWIFTFIFLLITSSLAISIAFRGHQGIFWQALLCVAEFALLSGTFALFFRFIPSTHVAWTRCLASGVGAAIFFLVGKTAISLYIRRTAIGSIYGAAASLVVLLIWFYYISITILVSYEFTNSIFWKQRSSRRRKLTRSNYGLTS
jgi:membrane protein